eukprot:c26135_g1_i1 orf=1057-2967(+)
MGHTNGSDNPATSTQTRSRSVNGKSSYQSLRNMVQDGSVDLDGKPVSRSRTGGWKSCAFIIGVELGERFAFYGIASNLIQYLTNVMHEGLATADKNVSNWTGVALVMPFIGGFFADAYVGRYWTIAVVCVVYVLGLVFLTLSATLHTLKPSACANPLLPCPKASSAQSGFFFFSLYLVAIGTGGVKPCLQAFGADQFDDEDPTEKKRKTSFFNWWYFGLCFGALLAFTVLVYIDQNVSWGLGFGIPAAVMVVALGIFLIGTPFYRHKRPGGSALTRIFQVIVAAIRKWNLVVPSDEKLLYENHNEESMLVGRRQLQHTDQFAFLDKAAVIDSRAEGQYTTQENPWRLCPVTQVEEVKLVTRVIPVWLTTFTYGVVITQISTLFTQQGATLDRRMGHFKIPPASFQAVCTIVVLLIVPLYDRILVPAARAFTGKERGISLLQRTGVGLFLSILCMITAALIEKKRLNAAKDHDLLDTPQVMIPMTIFWLLPQYIIIGIAEVFTLVGEQEFFYDQVPDTMKSLGMALYLGSNGVGSFLNSLLITIVNRISSRNGHNHWIRKNINRSHIDYYYYLLAALCALNFLLFLLVAHFYKYKNAKSFLASAASSPYRAAGTIELGLKQQNTPAPTSDQWEDPQC